jgi:ornithine decarboxylase
MEDLGLLDEYKVKVFRDEEDTPTIINKLLEGSSSEDAFFVVDVGKIIRQYQRWTEALPNVQPYYAVKANPNILILKVLASLGSNFDCASKNEIAAVLGIIGEESERIIFANPCKMSSQLKYARANDIDLLTFDSDHELYKIKLYHPNAKLILRLKVNDLGSKCQFGCKFGVPLEDVQRILSIAKTLDLNIKGVSFHVGSGCKDPDRYRTAIEDSLKSFEIARDLGFDMEILDIGGGFEDEPQDSFEQVSEVVRKSLDGFGGKVIAEPGRFFVSSSHTLVLNVIGKKTFEDTRTYYLNDGVYGAFNCIYFDHVIPKIYPYNERDGQVYKSKIFGPTCDSIDMIADSIDLPDLAIGEWVYVENFGAYTCAASSTFNGFSQTAPVYILTT